MPDLVYEQRLLTLVVRRVCGIDEVGRGPLAGPVYAAAVLLPDLTAPWGGLPKAVGEGLDDSKRLRPAKREALAQALYTHAYVGIGAASVEEIDRLNILQAALLAMSHAVAALPHRPDAALVDGKHTPRLPCPAHPLVSGDSLSLSIAAASIVAKVARDRHMGELAQAHPGYGWERNQGYGTAEHLEALYRLGPTPHHRQSFAPVAALIGMQTAS